MRCETVWSAGAGEWDLRKLEKLAIAWLNVSENFNTYPRPTSLGYLRMRKSTRSNLMFFEYLTLSVD